MGFPRFSLRELHEQLCSADAETRGQAMNRIVLWLEKDRSIGPTVVPLFQAVIGGETDSWTASRALDGLELVLGPAAKTQALQKLLAREDAFFVARLSLSADRPEHVPLLLKLVTERREIGIRSHVLRMLGRAKDARAFDAIVAEMAEPQLREDAIYALGDLGDPRGITIVEPYLNDNTPIGRQDDRGAMLYLSDAARDAILMMRRNTTSVPSPGTSGEG